MNGKKMIVVDLDGTLLNINKGCSDKSKKYLKKHIINVLKRHKQQRETQKLAFFAEERGALTRKNQREKRNRKHRKMYDC